MRNIGIAFSPHIETDENGVKWMVSEGWQKSRLRARISTASSLRARTRCGPRLAMIRSNGLRTIARDGIDAEIIFPNKGLMVGATQDPEFGDAQCRVYNDWAWETFGKYNSFMSPMAAIMTSDVKLAMAEIERTAKMGYRGLTLPCKPIFGNYDARHPNYNLGLYSPMWELIQETNLPITFHISTGRDLRAAQKDGGAVINYVSHSLSPTIEPIANMCASGVIEKYPKIRFAAIECGIGWVPWALDAMDEAYRKHHMWAFPKLPKMPSDYFRSNGATTFQEDRVGLDLAVKYNLIDNFMWANDYPHHEGSWPHSAEAIERQMGHLNEEQRAKILGLNAARIFNFDVDALMAQGRQLRALAQYNREGSKGGPVGAGFFNTAWLDARRYSRYDPFACELPLERLSRGRL